MDERPYSLSRRALLGGATAGAGLLAAPGLLRAQPRRLVFATWGGSWEKALKEAWFDPFTQQTGIPVVTVGGNTYGMPYCTVTDLSDPTTPGGSNYATYNAAAGGNVGGGMGDVAGHAQACAPPEYGARGQAGAARVAVEEHAADHLAAGV